MTPVNDPARAFTGRWLILQMGQWTKDYLDLVEEAHLTFEGVQAGQIAFGTLEASLEVIYVAHEQSAKAVFLWTGQDGADDVRGSGRAKLRADGRLVGHLHIKGGVSCAFVCERG